MGDNANNGSQNINNTNVGYTGHQWDNDTGLNYMQARYYDPLLARFYSNDPIGYTVSNPIMSFNRYMYVNNNPYKYTDPDGKLLCAGVCVVGGAIAVARISAIAYKAYRVGVSAGVATGVVGNVALNESSESENKGQGQAEVGDCSTCGGETSNKPGKIGKEHDLKPKEVRDKIHGAKNGKLTDNPDVEVCNDCGEIFPQTEDGDLGDSIGNIEDID